MADLYFPHLYYAQRSPAVTDDSSKGFIIGQTWIDMTQNPCKIYNCLDNTNNNSVWKKVGTNFADLENLPSPTLTIADGATGTCSFTDLGSATLNLVIDPSKHTHSSNQISDLDWTKISNKPDPKLTLAGDATGTCTFTDLGNATLSVSISQADWSKITNKPDPTLTITGNGSGTCTFTDLGNATLNLTIDPSTTPFLRTDANTRPIVDAAVTLGDPSYRFENIHAVTFTGTAAHALFSDLAEKYTCANKDLKVGTVVCVSTDESFDVEECNSIGSWSVLGVVSENPSFLMNSECDGVIVGRVGIVPCFVQGPIKKGQPLVSGLSGTAICAAGQTGKLLGNANESILDNSIKLIKIIL